MKTPKNKYGLSIKIYGDMNAEQYEEFLCVIDEYKVWISENTKNFRRFERYLGGLYPVFNKSVWGSMQGLNLSRFR